ncbi:MAG: hypothetical protein M1818_007640 [Claussenomyces sp. TS43310]|nr:MAG: hypothetical protein M1818_007640 [Claussenomyces sp. TS43310]
MITRSRNGVHVCLRCQLRCCQRPLLWCHASRDHRVRQQHTAAKVGSSDGKHVLIQSEKADASGRAAEAPTIKLRRVRSRLKTADSEEERWREFPLGKLHGFKEHALGENVQELNVDSLGKPAEVIVLKQAGIRYSYPKPHVTELDQIEPVDILARLDSERGLADQAEVSNNIDELIPDIGKSISWEDFKDIEKQLIDGFTAAQLARYIASHDAANTRNTTIEINEQSGSLTHKEELPDSPIIRVSLWMPGVSETGAQFHESSVRGYVSDIAFTQKQRLVVQLMRQCWQLEVQEVAESLGELEVQVRSRELELLINGRNPPLGSISARSLLSEDEQIEVFRSRHVIRITATKDKALNIVTEVREVLRNIRHLELDMEALPPSQSTSLKYKKTRDDMALKNTVLAELRNLTGAEINQLPRNKATITCIDENPGTTISTANDVIRRLLLTSSDAANRAVKRHACKELAAPVMAVKYERTEGLSWRDRLDQWARWTVSISKLEAMGPLSSSEEPIETSASDPTSKSTDREQSVRISSGRLRDKQMTDHVALEDQTQRTESFSWSDSYMTTSSAVVGHVLHQISESDTSTASPVHALIKDRTNFIPATLNVSRLLGYEKKSLNMRPVTSLRMRFLPDPWNAGSQQAKGLGPPPIEMRFRIDPSTKDVELKDVLAITESTMTDVLLPDRALDLRFRQRTTSRLMMMRGQQVPQISNFLKDSQLNLRQGALVTPPSLTLPIVPRICDHKGKLAEIDSGSFDVEYLFAGLEYRTSFATSFKGWTLLYTSIEGGKANGRRSELSLRPQLNPQSGQRGKSDTVQSHEELSSSFVNDAFSLIDALQLNHMTGAGNVEAIKPDIRGMHYIESGRVVESKSPEVSYFPKKLDFTRNVRLVKDDINNPQVSRQQETERIDVTARAPDQR